MKLSKILQIALILLGIAAIYVAVRTTAKPTVIKARLVEDPDVCRAERLLVDHCMAGYEECEKNALKLKQILLKEGLIGGP